MRAALLARLPLSLILQLDRVNHKEALRKKDAHLASIGRRLVPRQRLWA